MQVFDLMLVLVVFEPVSMVTGEDWRSCRALRKMMAMKMTIETALILWQQRESRSAGRKVVADVQILSIRF